MQPGDLPRAHPLVRLHEHDIGVVGEPVAAASGSDVPGGWELGPQEVQGGVVIGLIESFRDCCICLIFIF